MNMLLDNIVESWNLSDDKRTSNSFKVEPNGFDRLAIFPS